MLRLLGHVFVAHVDHRMLLQLPLSKNMWSRQSMLLCTVGAPSGTWLKSPVISTRRLSSEKRGEMSMLRRLGSFSILWFAVIVLASSSDAVAQVRYKITDLGVNTSKDNFSMAMG